MSDPTPPVRPPGDGSAELPEGHLALVIEDAVAELDGADGEPRAGPDLRAALLYGWATGAMTSRELALRGAADAGLRRLLDGEEPSFRDIRAYRDGHAADLETFYERVFRLLALAGVSRLGRVSLPPIDQYGAADPFRGLARELLGGAATADLRDDRELGQAVRGDELPPELAERTSRHAAFHDALSRGGLADAADLGLPRDAQHVGDGGARAAVSMRARAGSPLSMQVLGVAVTMLVVFAALLLVRWLSSSPALAGAEAKPGGEAAASAPATASAPLSASSATPGPGQTPEESEGDLQDARDEAMRLAGDALDDDDLQTAHDYYFLATKAAPDDQEAADRLREVQTALSIDNWRGSWDDAVTDLDDLRANAPDSGSVLQAYVTALVGTGREALAARDQERAAALCGEAARRLPLRADARSCLQQIAGPPTATPEPTATLPPSTPTPAPTETAVRPRATVLGPATPIGITVPGASPTDTATDQGQDTLRVRLTASCQPSAGADGGATLHISGGVSSAGGPVPSVRLVASATSPSGEVIPIASTTYLTPIFQLQQRVDDTGVYVITVTADKEGYNGGRAAARVTC